MTMSACLENFEIFLSGNIAEQFSSLESYLKTAEAERAG